MYRGRDWYPPYVPVAERRRKATREMEKLSKKGRAVEPVTIGGKTIVTTFWGKAWCDNLESYSDYENRLPRGRTYVRNGSVLDLQITAGEIKALVSGSRIYTVRIRVSALPKDQWRAICADCAGAIDSLVELLQGRFSQGVMERLCRQRTGLFPSPDDIDLSCTCPDWATMCKHVAAVLYGVGARLDEQPELLFRLRKVNQRELVSAAGAEIPLSKKQPAKEKILKSDNLSEIFGLDLGALADDPLEAAAKPAGKRRPKTIAPAVEVAVRPRKNAARSKTKAKPQAGKHPRKNHSQNHTH